jgi:pimeloyl-ACP methyl ester carboxylesterase
MALSTQLCGEGRPLVLLPWFGLDGSVMAAAWEPVLADTGWQRMYIDLPGTGESDPVEPRSDAVADAVAETIDSLTGGSPVALAGCSYGGYIAAELARRDPASVTGLLLVCSGVRILPGERNLSGVQPSIPEPGWLDGVPEEFRAHFETAVGVQTREVAECLTAAFRLNGPSDEKYLAALRSDGFQLTGERGLASLDPVLTVAAGRHDRVAGYRDQFDLASGSRSGDYILLDGVGHYLPFEEPERFWTLALDWLARCPAS